jgi:SAM-dependent methyltransferase
MKAFGTSVLLVTGIAVGLMGGPVSSRQPRPQPLAAGPVSAPGQDARPHDALATNIPYSDAKPIFEALRESLWPADLRGIAPGELESAWPDWVSRRDAAIRARVEEGEADSVVHLLLYGTAFTTESLTTASELAALADDSGGVPDRLQTRLEDFLAGVASPGTNERLQFARQVLEREGFDTTTDAGRNGIRRYLTQRMKNVGSTAVRSFETLVNDPTAESQERRTLFRDRGLTFNTSIFVNLAIEEALEALKREGLLQPGTVRRVGIVGPGLEFTEKQDGYDFYSPQTIQPFAVIDSILRLGLGEPDELRVTAFDLSPRIVQHIEAARARARAGSGYPLVLPRSLERPWLPGLVRYWERFGDRIGESVEATAPPEAGRVDVRSVLVRPSFVLSTTPLALNVILQRLEPLPPGEPFDLILATNILIYYDIFEQSLAVTNIAKMLRPGGVFLSNDRFFELPGVPVRSMGHVDVNYMAVPGVGETGDRVVWYQRP